MKSRILAAVLAMLVVTVGIAPAEQPAADDPLAHVEITNNSTPDKFDIRIQAPATGEFASRFGLGGLLSYLSSVALAKPSALKGGKGSPDAVTPPPPPPTITSILLSNAEFLGGAADGTVVGTISVQMSEGSFSGSLSLAGGDGDKFAIDGSNLVLNGTQPGGVYSVAIVATQDGAAASPFTSLKLIHGSPAVELTGITLSNNSFLGDAADGTVVGTISVQAAGGLFTGALSLDGIDASRFAISGNDLILSGSQPAGAYSVNIIATQLGAVGSPLSSVKTITGSTIVAITGVTLSNDSFVGGAPDNTVVGAISVQTTAGPFSGTLSLTGTDAARFEVSGGNLILNGTQAAGSYSINIVATQTGASGSPFSQSETITGSVTPAITGITLSKTSFQGGSADGTVVGAISVQTTGGLFSGTLSLTGTDAARFGISGDNLVLNGTQAAGAYSVNIVATQTGASGSPFSAPQTIAGIPSTTIDGVSLSNSSFTGGSASGTVVGAISVQTTGGAFTGALSLTGTDAARFAISGSNLVLNGTQPAGTYAVSIVATQTGASGSPFTSAKSINGSIPVALTGITLSKNTFAAGAPDNTVVGAISVQTTGGAFTGSLSLTGTDAAKFKISSGNLLLNGTQTAGTYSINIVATQANAIGSPLSSAKTITGGTTITGITLAGSSFIAGSADGTTVGTISVQTVGSPFAGTLSLSGTDAARFKLSGNALQTNGVQGEGVYSISITAAASGVIGSPFIKPVTINGYPAPVVGATENKVTVTDASGSTQTNYPLRIARPFVCGEIANYPQVVNNGTPLTTQADVKNRCPDGSVKFAVISAVLPTIAANSSRSLTFQNQASGNNTAASDAALLAQFSDFDAVIRLTKPATMTGTFETDINVWKTVTSGSLSIVVNGTTYNITGINLAQQPNVGYVANMIGAAIQAKQVPATFTMTSTQAILSGGTTISLGTPATGQNIAALLFKSGVSTAAPSAPVSVSARQMLTDGKCQRWTSGPVAQTMVCADRTAARAYDLGPGGSTWRPLHPEFVVTFWPTTDQVFLRYVGEVSNTQALEAFTADVKLTAGVSSPATVYEQAAVPHSIATRWTRTTWLGGTPEARVNIDHTIGYLSDANWLPNYDRSLRIPESELALTYSRWGTAEKKIGGAGIWRKDMPAVSYHPDIGHMPLWYNQAVYSGDWRMRATMLGQADLAGAFPAQLREGDPAKKADRAQVVPAIGLPVTVYARPTSWHLDPRDGATAADKIVVRSPKYVGVVNDLYQGSAFLLDWAHQPDPFFVPYLMTGDPFYLDGLLLWAGYDSLMDNPNYRFGPYAVIYDGQNRTNAWILRTRLHAALAAPDADPMKPIFDGMIDDALAYWEGLRNFTGTTYETSAIWKLANNLFKTGQDGFKGLGPHPLGWFVPGLGAGTGAWDCTTSAVYYDLNVCATTNGPWQQNFVILEFGRAVELGYPADRLFALVGKNIIGQLTSAGYNARHIGQYQIPDAKKVTTPPGFAYFQTWDEVMSAWSLTFRNKTTIEYWPQTGKEFYWDVARGAAGMAATLPNGALAWQKLGELIASQTAQTGQAPNWNIDPTWAIVPRSP